MKCVANPKHTKVVVAPALDLFVLKQSARMVPTSRDRSRSRTKIDIRKIVAHLADRAAPRVTVS